MTTTPTAPLPPGSRGLPLLGETLAFLKDSFGFIEKRVLEHGPVFRTHLLGRDTAVIVGPEACARWIDPGAVERKDAMPPHVKELFGGESLPSLDGAAHTTRKRLVLAGFTRDALTSYLPTLERTTAAALASYAEQGELATVEPLKQLAITTVASTVLGMSPGPVLGALLSDYAAIGPGLGSLPIPMPGTAFTRARAAMARILAVYEQAVLDHQAAPRDDGLSRMLAARTPEGARLSIDDAKREVHHIVIAGLIIWAEFAGTLRYLAGPGATKVREALRREVDALGDGPLTLDTLWRAERVRRAVMEVKRMSPVVPAQFGRARADFELAGRRIPQGWMVLWGVHSTNHFAPVFAAPDQFDPDRFIAAAQGGRAEDEKDPHAFVPQGPGPAQGHRCPGLDFATAFMTVFMVHLLRGYSWELPEQNLDLRWAMIPPEPIDGLRVRFARRDAPRVRP